MSALLFFYSLALRVITISHHPKSFNLFCCSAWNSSSYQFPPEKGLVSFQSHLLLINYQTQSEKQIIERKKKNKEYIYTRQLIIQNKNQKKFFFFFSKPKKREKSLNNKCWRHNHAFKNLYAPEFKSLTYCFLNNFMFRKK